MNSRGKQPVFFALLCALLFSCQQPVRERKTGILALGDVDRQYIQVVMDSLKSAYGIQPDILVPAELPSFAFIHVKSPRYRADSLLKHLSGMHPGYDYIMAITAEDISITKYSDASRTKVKTPEYKYSDYGIFGLGQRPGRATVLSVNRITKGVSDKKGKERTGRIAIHEMGHNLGLRHCENATCVMTDAMESIRTIDNSSGSLCRACYSDIR